MRACTCKKRITGKQPLRSLLIIRLPYLCFIVWLLLKRSFSKVIMQCDVAPLSIIVPVYAEMRTFIVTYSWVSRDVKNITGSQLQIDTQLSKGKILHCVCGFCVWQQICAISCDLFTSVQHNHETFWVDPHSDLLQNASVKPKNSCLTNQ